MEDQLTALTTIFTELYYWLTVVFMFFIHLGFCMYEVGASRRKNLLHTLMKNTMLIPLVTMGTFFWGWWIYFSFTNVPFNTGGFVSAPWSLPWSELMGAHMGGVSTQPELLSDGDVLNPFFNQPRLNDGGTLIGNAAGGRIGRIQLRYSF